MNIARVPLTGLVWPMKQREMNVGPSHWRSFTYAQLIQHNLVSFSKGAARVFAPVADALLLWNQGAFTDIYTVEKTDLMQATLLDNERWLREVLLPIHNRVLEERQSLAAERKARREAKKRRTR